MLCYLPRRVQLHVQTYMLLLAALPGYAVAQQLAIVYAPHMWVVLLVTAIITFIYGSRL